jgi:hypothetical protein
LLWSKKEKKRHIFKKNRQLKIFWKINVYLYLEMTSSDGLTSGERKWKVDV